MSYMIVSHHLNRYISDKLHVRIAREGMIDFPMRPEYKQTQQDYSILIVLQSASMFI